jgi:hypothetical protein
MTNQVDDSDFESITLNEDENEEFPTMIPEYKYINTKKKKKLRNSID